MFATYAVQDRLDNYWFETTGEPELYHSEQGAQDLAAYLNRRWPDRGFRAVRYIARNGTLVKG